MEMTIDEVIKELEWALANNTIEDVDSAYKYILAIHMAIDTMRKYQKFQDQALSLYMERLKADMVAMLEDLRLDFQEAELAGVLDNKELIFADEVDDLVQQKINDLKGE